MKSKLKGYKEIPIGGLILDAGNAKTYKTGGWRSKRPILDKSNCINCYFCWFYCPDNSVDVKDKDVKGFKLDYCKGCGICAVVCPKKCIKMEDEDKFEE
ncbi:MAG: 4Fe-4S binding protein [Spirochaetes bacterium]|nr:4Fe-4S binding protein [Spirochaetota bacterium]